MYSKEMQAAADLGRPVPVGIGNWGKMVVDAVQSEPVPALFSLLTGKKQGKFVNFA
jgi:hypothetical protein